MDYRWHIRQLTASEAQIQQQLESELNISSATARMLVVRGILTADAARDFVRPSLDKLHDPFLMKDMDLAVERLHRALTQGEKILIYGDYDVDGTTAVAVMYRFLSSIGNREAIDYYIPDRYTEGYGVSAQGIDYAAENACTLIITLDCGIKAVEKVAYAKSKGIDVIVCDHHTPGDELPAAVAVLNMKRSDCPYPYKDLSGCGVGFKVAQAYVEKYIVGDEASRRRGEILIPLFGLVWISFMSLLRLSPNRLLLFFRRHGYWRKIPSILTINLIVLMWDFGITMVIQTTCLLC